MKFFGRKTQKQKKLTGNAGIGHGAEKKLKSNLLPKRRKINEKSRNCLRKSGTEREMRSEK